MEEEPLLGWRKGGYDHLIVAALMMFNLPFLMLQLFWDFCYSLLNRWPVNGCLTVKRL